MVLAPVALVCAFYLGGCTTGGPLQNRAVSGGLPSLWPAVLPWGPHHPSEGSQLQDVYGAVLHKQRPHHPSEGSQLVGRGDLGRYGLVLITPQRDRNPRRWWRVTVMVRSSSPLRGIATRCGRRGWRSGRVLITPQRDRNLRLSAWPPDPRRSSSPLRGIATPGGSPPCAPR